MYIFLIISVSLVQSLSRVWLFVTPWTAAHQASLSITNSQSLLKLMSAESMMSSNHLILFCPLVPLPKSLPASESFPMSQLFALGGQSIGVSSSASVLPMNIQDWAWRDKKAFLSDQCKETEENNRIGKTSDLFKKIRDTKGKFHANMSTIKDRKGKDLTEAEEIKKRWQEHTEELYKKGLNDPDNHDGRTPRVRLSGMWSQVGFRKHCYEQS